MSDDEPAPPTSPPCFLHELEPSEAGTEAVDQQQRKDVARWRKAERERQYELRRALDRDERAQLAARIAEHIEHALGDIEGRTIALYWPIRREPDLRGLIERIMQRGGRCALPVVVERDAPLAFRAWAPGDELERGLWNIPVPVAGAEITPDAVVAPVVAFDRDCYRLGNGGGYYDRTLAALRPRPRVLGVGFAHACVPTIYPQPHDIPMDAVVTPEGVARRTGIARRG